MLNRHRYGFLLVAVLLLTGFSDKVAAQSISHQFKLGLETRVFRFMNVTVEPDNSSFERDWDYLEFGLFSTGGSYSNALTVFAAPAASLGTDLAYGLSDHLLLGSRVVFDYSHLEDGDSVWQLDFVPHLDFVFSLGRSFKPFLGAQLGIQTVNASDGTDESGTIFMVGASLGAFVFVGRSVSIDPRLSFLYSFGSADVSALGGTAEADVSSISLAFMLGISVWL
jgi:hypothetical protein